MKPKNKTTTTHNNARTHTNKNKTQNTREHAKRKTRQWYNKQTHLQNKTHNTHTTTWDTSTI